MCTRSSVFIKTILFRILWPQAKVYKTIVHLHSNETSNPSPEKDEKIVNGVMSFVNSYKLTCVITNFGHSPFTVGEIRWAFWTNSVKRQRERKNVIRISVFRVHNRYSTGGEGEQRSSSEFDGEKLPNQKYIRLKSFRRKSFYWNNFSFTTIHCRGSLYLQTPSNVPIRDNTHLVFLDRRRLTTNIFPVVRFSYFSPMCVFAYLIGSRPITGPCQFGPLPKYCRSGVGTGTNILFATKFW